MRSLSVGRRNVGENSAKVLYSPTYAEISYKINETRYILISMDSNNLKVKNIVKLYPNNTFYYFDEFIRAGYDVVVQLGDFWILDLVGAQKFQKLKNGLSLLE